MPLGPLIALALLAADPQVAGPQVAGSQVMDLIATAPTAARPPAPEAPQKPVAPKTPPSPADLAFDEPLPAGAPEDDYGFVAWCFGALDGHMKLFNKVLPELNKLHDPDPSATKAADADMMQAGSQYLQLYAKAMAAAAKASPTPIGARGTAMIKQGQSVWDAANAADSKTQMWSWVMWVLPGRCEYAAERLYEHSMVDGQARGIDMRTEPVPKPKPTKRR